MRLYNIGDEGYVKVSIFVCVKRHFSKPFTLFVIGKKFNQNVNQNRRNSFKRKTKFFKIFFSLCSGDTEVTYFELEIILFTKTRFSFSEI